MVTVDNTKSVVKSEIDAIEQNDLIRAFVIWSPYKYMKLFTQHLTCQI